MKKLILITTLSLIIASPLFAKGAGQFMPQVRQEFPSAEKTIALRSASENLDLSTINSFAVLKQGGIPAERAAHFIGWGEYDYRGTEIDLEKNSISSRRGKIYTYLKKGDVLAVADVFSLGRKIYFTMITPEPYVPTAKASEKHHSRVTLTLIFKMPKDLRDAGDSERALSLLKEWIEPFKTYDKAKEYAETIKDKPSDQTDDEVKQKTKDEQGTTTEEEQEESKTNKRKKARIRSKW